MNFLQKKGEEFENKALKVKTGLARAVRGYCEEVAGLSGALAKVAEAQYEYEATLEMLVAKREGLRAGKIRQEVELEFDTKLLELEKKKARLQKEIEELREKS